MKRKMYIDDKLEADFDGFWDFWDAMTDHVRECCGMKKDDALGLPNHVMIAAYAANVWFRRGMWATGPAERSSTVSTAAVGKAAAKRGAKGEAKGV